MGRRAPSFRRLLRTNAKKFPYGQKTHFQTAAGCTRTPGPSAHWGDTGWPAGDSARIGLEVPVAAMRLAAHEFTSGVGWTAITSAFLLSREGRVILVGYVRR
jgi:hypothetical protein